jgi:hypothetical protein
MPVDTTKVQGRRQVSYSSLQEVLADAERLSKGKVKTLGNWSAGQIFRHLATGLDVSIDGTKAKFPWWLRLVAPLFKSKLINSPMPPGFKLPAGAAPFLEPGPVVSTDEGLSALRTAIARQEKEPNRAASPVFGPLTRDEWNRIHLHHAALHMSYLVPES